MEPDTKRVLGRIMGEIFRLQRHLKPEMCPVSDATIYGLLNGLETAIDEAFEGSPITEAQYSHTVHVLDDIFKDPAKMKNFKGFYDIESTLEAGGVDRSDAIIILTYLWASNRFQELIKKMDTTNSPGECRTFDIDKYDI